MTTIGRLPDTTTDAFERDGAVALRQIVGSDELVLLAAAIERDIASPGPYFHGYDVADGGRFHGNLRLWQHDPVLAEFCRHSGLPALAGQLMHTRKVNLLYDQLFVKEARTDFATRWHNDQPYWAIRGHQVVSIWLALDHTTPATGALEFVRGSHRWQRWFQPQAFGPTAGFSGYEQNPDYEPMPDIDAARSNYDIVSWDLAPGDAYAFHGLTVHGARGNSGGGRRRGYTIRYTGDDARYDTRPGTNEALRNPELRDGDKLDSTMFPVVIR